MSRLLLSVAGALLAGAVQAQVPVIGKLFATPAERAQLDKQRAAGVTAPPAGPADPNAAPPPPPTAPGPIEVNGILRRSSGRSTVWINNLAQHDANNAISARGPKAALNLRLTSGKKIILKAGQRYELVDGTIKDVDTP